MTALSLKAGAVLISIKSHLIYAATQPCDVLLQIEAAEGAGQTCISGGLSIEPGGALRAVAGEEGVGQRVWFLGEGTFECTYEAQVDVRRTQTDLSGLAATPLQALPHDVIKFLMPSRYCHPEAFLDVTATQFGALSGGDLVQAMSGWVGERLVYDPAASTATTTATDTLAQGAGVCRDYAHMLIAMLRAVGMPARFVSAYGPRVTPQDFHAVVEVYLAGAWHLLDPTGMTSASETVRIGVGRDAADVSFMTSYGMVELIKQTVEVWREP